MLEVLEFEYLMLELGNIWVNICKNLLRDQVNIIAQKL